MLEKQDFKTQDARVVDGRLYLRKTCYRSNGSTNSCCGSASKGFAEVGGEDVELFAVFGDGATGNGDALGGEGLHEGLVGKGFGGVFVGDELLECFTDAGIGDFAAVFGLVSGGEERAHFC